MPQTNAAQRAEAARLLARVARGDADCWDEQRLLTLLPALLADAEALAEREAEESAPDPPVVAGPLSRVPVTIRVGGPARAIRYDKATLTNAVIDHNEEHDDDVRD